MEARASQSRLSTMALALGVVVGISGASVTVQRDWSLIRPLQTSDVAPDFNLQSLERGDRVTLETWSQSGGLTLIDFWATWCQPCLVAMPQIEAIHRDYHNDNVRILSVNIERDDVETVRSFLQNHPMPFEVWIDDDRMAARYDVSLYPTFVLIEDKRVVGILRVCLDWSEPKEKSKLGSIVSVINGDVAYPSYHVYLFCPSPWFL